MKKNRTKAIIALAVFLAAIFGCMFAADRIQTGSDSIDVTEGWIETDVGNLFYKLYTPRRAQRRNARPPAFCSCTGIRTTTRPARLTPWSLRAAARWCCVSTSTVTALRPPVLLTEVM